jgi:hypothetical protein
MIIGLCALQAIPNGWLSPRGGTFWLVPARGSDRPLFETGQLHVD